MRLGGSVLMLTAAGLAFAAIAGVTWCRYALVGLFVVVEGLLPDPPGPRRYP